MYWVLHLTQEFSPFQKLHNFPFGPWTIVHGGQKIESAQKIHAMIQVEVDVKCTQTNFGGCSFSGFGDFAPLQK